ncbi:hypothetical protein HPB50_023800 [Hyalomma asiaticum]|uniref:Uncharacterized protein n=1 Tax=Hyalomma asiaticum TaxID=266040 RepID=A0ACB7SST0_HYAAI|nr:hypothetical protein HPB50_023800 [Hyalomma asiaticum]
MGKDSAKSGGKDVEKDAADVRELSKAFENFKRELRLEMREIKDSITFCSETCSDVKDAATDIRNMRAEIQELIRLNAELKAENKRLSQRCDELEQYQRLNNLEIKGAPVGNDPVAVVTKISEAVGMTVDFNDIDTCHWVRTPKPGSVHLPRRTTKAIVDEDFEIDVVACVTSMPERSIRQIAGKCGRSVGTITNVLRKHKFHPCHVYLHRDLNEADFESDQQEVSICRPKPAKEFELRALLMEEMPAKPKSTGNGKFETQETKILQGSGISVKDKRSHRNKEVRKQRTFAAPRILVVAYTGCRKSPFRANGPDLLEGFMRTPATRCPSSPSSLSVLIRAAELSTDRKRRRLNLHASTRCGCSIDETAEVFYL